MKKLQNNFTTPEQSKRLLELGVPADSADCYYSAIDHYTHPVIWHTDVSKFLGTKRPCWSVGRLIEIMQICCDRVYVLQPHKTDIMQVVLEDIFALKYVLDFSKLND